MDISAPGSLDSDFGIECASGTGDTIVRDTGTSFAAPTVAGLCAYFMSLYPALTATGGTAGRVKSFVKSQMWSRNSGPPAVWNMQQSTPIDSSPNSRKRAAIEKRQTVSDATCPDGVLSGWPTLMSGSSPPPVDWTPPGWEPASGSSNSSANASSSIASSTSITASALSPSSTQIASSKVPDQGNVVHPSGWVPVLESANPSFTIPVSTTTGVLDGASWLDPTSFCDFGSATYPTISLPTTITNPAELCAYTSLNPSNAITPKTTAAIPTNRPGYGGVPACAAVDLDAAHQDCPFAIDGWCSCGGVLVPPLAPTLSGFINCAITVQPAANDCPVNTAYSESLAAASASSASAASVSAAHAKATPNTIVSSFACPTNAVVGGPDGLGNGQSNQQTLVGAEARKLSLWASFNSWGCDMPKYADNSAAASDMCGGIASNTVLSLGIGNQPFYMNSTSQTADDPNCRKQFYNMAFTVKDNCEVPLTKEYCMAMYNNIVQSCPILNPSSGATWEGGLATDNCGVAYFTSGYDIQELTPDEDNNPFFDLTSTYWWE